MDTEPLQNSIASIFKANSPSHGIGEKFKSIEGKSSFHFYLVVPGKTVKLRFHIFYFFLKIRNSNNARFWTNDCENRLVAQNGSGVEPLLKQIGAENSFVFFDCDSLLLDVDPLLLGQERILVKNEFGVNFDIGCQNFRESEFGKL